MKGRKKKGRGELGRTQSLKKPLPLPACLVYMPQVGRHVMEDVGCDSCLGTGAFCNDRVLVPRHPLGFDDHVSAVCGHMCRYAAGIDALVSKYGSCLLLLQ